MSDMGLIVACTAWTRATADCETIFQRLFQRMIHASEKFLFRLFPHHLVVFREQRIRRIESEKRDSVKTSFAQVWRKNAFVCQGVAINLARRLVGQLAGGGLFVACIHLLVAFVTM